MKTILTVKNMETCDKNTILNKMPQNELINLVGIKLQEKIGSFLNVLIMVGKGNNGKDGLALAYHLFKNGVKVTILNVYDIDNNEYFTKRLLDNNIPFINEIDDGNYDLLVDAIFGVGFKGKLDENVENIVKKANEMKCYKIAIDINSGLDATSGKASVAFKSNKTIAIQYYKPGHFLNDAKDYIDNIDLIDVGIDNITRPIYLFEKDDFDKCFIKRKYNSNKKDYGYVSIFGGSISYPGSVKLSTLGTLALVSGCGIVKLVVMDNLAKYYIHDVFEQTLYPFRSDEKSFIFDKKQLDYLIKSQDVIAFGMGMDVNDETKSILRYLISNYEGKLLIDASGLSILLSLGCDILDMSNASIILTPHIKEFSRLIGVDVDTILDDPIEYVEQFVNNHKNVTLLLKGSSTIVADHSNTYIINKGNPILSKGGSGDIQSGIIAGMLGYLNATDATLCGTYLFLDAADMLKDKVGTISSVGRDIIEEVKNVLSLLDKTLE